MKDEKGEQLRALVVELLKSSNKYSEILDPMIDGYVRTCAVRDRLGEDIEKYGAVLEEKRGENTTYKANPAITGFNNASKEARQALMTLGMDSKSVSALEGDVVDLLTQRLNDIN
ncbi:P27 family phage terminase small subunit [Porphyromonas somerae]|uniref:P27 family phage terminase small subunit n=1 Tax=Porphyromonas somerae TaxID=322095 RepID=UPI001FCA7073|nr:P27 family phage terminase small subunit [Porphyromonas somerae]BDE81776.1 hypothetical protein CE91St14_08040 [Porphyromonas somerae]